MEVLRQPAMYMDMRSSLVEPYHVQAVEGLVEYPESENELVALIPVRDKRLRPSKTKWYVTLSVGVCLIIGSLLLYFLFPRNITLSAVESTLVPSFLYINTSARYVDMGLINGYRIKNDNFYGITIDKLETQVFFDRKILSDITNKTSIYISPRSRGYYVMQLNVTFKGEEGYIAAFCDSQAKYGHTIIMPFQTTMYVHLMGRIEETTLTSYQHVRCSPDLVSTTTIKPVPIVTTPSTTLPTTPPTSLSSLGT